MSYTQLAVTSVLLAGAIDMWAIRTRLLISKVFWTSYAIIVSFQLLTNWWLTSRNIVIYDRHAITGVRIASAPVEDLLFGFALVLGVLTLWVFWGRRENQRAARARK